MGQQSAEIELGIIHLLELLGMAVSGSDC